MKMVRRRRRTSVHILLATLMATFIILMSMLAATGLNEGRMTTPLLDKYESYCTNDDDIAPIIELVGEPEIAMVQGAQYVEPGAEYSDYCGIVGNEMLGSVDTTIPGAYKVHYLAVDSRGNQAEAVREVTVKPMGRGVVYLTFDDGPGPHTAALLDILAKYNVKATFFVTGMGDDALIAREYREGHAVGLHTASHRYDYIYQNMDVFFADLYAVQERVRNITGHDSTLMRFPGGSSNSISARYDGGAHIMSQLVAEVGRRGFTYFDWNVVSGDAGQTTSTDEVFANVIAGFREGGVSVVLQHDIKDFSVAAVERIIQYGLENGWTFDKLSVGAPAIHHNVNN